jgi:hypothetical protein
VLLLLPPSCAIEKAHADLSIAPIVSKLEAQAIRTKELELTRYGLADPSAVSPSVSFISCITLDSCLNESPNETILTHEWNWTLDGTYATYVSFPRCLSSLFMLTLVAAAAAPTESAAVPPCCCSSSSAGCYRYSSSLHLPLLSMTAFIKVIKNLSSDSLIFFAVVILCW